MTKVCACWAVGLLLTAAACSRDSGTPPRGRDAVAPGREGPRDDGRRDGPRGDGATIVRIETVEGGPGDGGGPPLQGAVPGQGSLPDASGASARRNVLLLTVDSLRADQPWTGYERPVAPRLTELAGRSVVYTRAYSVSSYTAMSLGGLLGGKLPSELKRDGFFFGTYHKDNLFFPEVLQSAGVRTMGGHAHGYFSGAAGGFRQGFDAWQVVQGIGFKNTTDENITSPQLEALAEQMLGAPNLGETPFFAWFHFMDPHDKYLPHEGIGPYGAKIRDLYDAEVTFTDRSIGKLLDFVASKPWAQTTAILVSADHGEALGEHKQFSHGFELWDVLTRVPLLIQIPGVAPRRIDEPRSAVDLAPTILDLMGVPTPPEMGVRGQSLVSEINGGPAPARDVFLDLPVTSDNDYRRALVHGNEKVISFPLGLFQTYDLASDPDETKPLAPGEASAAAVKRFRIAFQAVADVPPYACKEGCLNGAYLKKDAGPPSR